MPRAQNYVAESRADVVRTRHEVAEHLGCTVDARDSLVGSVIAGRRTSVITGCCDRVDDSFRHAVQRKRRELLPERRDWALEVAYREVHGLDDRRQLDAHRTEVVAVSACRRGVALGLPPRGL